MNLTGESKIYTNWSAIAAIIMTVFTITTFYTTIRSEIDELKKTKLDKDEMEKFANEQNRANTILERNIIDIMKLQMKIAEKNNVDFDRDYYESKIKKFNER